MHLCSLGRWYTVQQQREYGKLSVTIELFVFTEIPKPAFVPTGTSDKIGTKFAFPPALHLFSLFPLLLGKFTNTRMCTIIFATCQCGTAELANYFEVPDTAVSVDINLTL